MDLNPQQQLFFKAYTDPKSPTFGNALQSALSAGYKQEYAENITHLMPDWLSENLGKAKLVQKAERNMDMALDGLLDDPERGAKTIQHKASEFVLKTLKKDTYSERTELTGKDGKDLPTPIIQLPNGVPTNDSI
jgi:hypothetical protein